jgi:hypothetical protein
MKKSARSCNNDTRDEDKRLAEDVKSVEGMCQNVDGNDERTLSFEKVCFASTAQDEAGAGAGADIELFTPHSSSA